MTLSTEVECHFRDMSFRAMLCVVMKVSWVGLLGRKSRIQ